MSQHTQIDGSIDEFKLAVCYLPQRHELHAWNVWERCQIASEKRRCIGIERDWGLEPYNETYIDAARANFRRIDTLAFFMSAVGAVGTGP